MRPSNQAFKSIEIKNLLSFGEKSVHLDLEPLNILIGPNGSGKSNFLEVLGLLGETPSDLLEPIREGGGIFEWLFKGGKKSPSATIETIVSPIKGKVPVRYRLTFTRLRTQVEITDERIETERPLGPQHNHPLLFFGFQNGRPVINNKETDKPRVLQKETIDPSQSVLSQRRDPDHYPELADLANLFGSIRLYRDWEFGINSSARDVFAADLPSNYLLEDLSNLGLMLNRLTSEPNVNRKLTEYLRLFYPEATDVHAVVKDGRIEVQLEEKRGFVTPAVRLSDGTLRWLALLTILLNPDPAPLVCIEEPELGLHPDMIPTLAALFREASAHMQLVVTTHSAGLIEEFSDHPEAVVVCEKHESCTSFRRLDGAGLKTWLERYTLGELWKKGQIGGTRW